MIKPMKIKLLKAQLSQHLKMSSLKICRETGLTVQPKVQDKNV